MLPEETMGMLGAAPANSQEAEGSWLAWRGGSREVAGKEAAGVGS